MAVCWRFPGGVGHFPGHRGGGGGEAPRIGPSAARGSGSRDRPDRLARSSAGLRTLSQAWAQPHPFLLLCQAGGSRAQARGAAGPQGSGGAAPRPFRYGLAHDSGGSREAGGGAHPKGVFGAPGSSLFFFFFICSESLRPYEKGDRLHAVCPRKRGPIARNPPPPPPPKKRGPIARAQLGTYSPFAVLALGVGGTGVGLGIRVRHPLTVAKVSSGHTTRTSRNAWRAFFRKSFTVP